MIQSTILNFAKKSEEMQQIPLEDYVVCIILCQEVEDTLEEAENFDGLADVQEAELALREKYQNICNSYLRFQEEQRRSDIRDGLQEYRKALRHVPLKEISDLELMER